MSSFGDALQAQIKLAANQQSDDYRSVVYGHIASYDPKTSRARFVVPSFTDDGVNYVLTGWAPLHTGFTGAGGWGLQFAPFGGATSENPTGGEPCIIHFSERKYGVVSHAQLLANQTNTPPNQTLKPGECVMSSKSGSVMYFKEDGSMNMTTQGAMNMTASDAVTIEGSAVNAGSAGTFKTVVMKDFQAVYNTHTHGGGPVPDQQMTDDQLTSTFKAN